MVKEDGAEGDSVQSPESARLVCDDGSRPRGADGGVDRPHRIQRNESGKQDGQESARDSQRVERQ